MHSLPHLCTHCILYRRHMTLPFAMGKRPAAPCLHAVTPVVCVLLSCAFLLQGTNELMRYVSCWENMTNRGSEYVGRNVPKHEVYIQGNCLLSQKSALQHLLGLGFLFFCTDFSCFIYTALKDLLRSSPLFFLIYFFCFFKYQTAWEKKKQNWGYSLDQRSKAQKKCVK